MNVSVKSFVRDASWSAKIGAAVILAYIVVAVFAPVIAPFGENEIVATQYEPWGDRFLLGTDNIGRDMLTRLIYGARNTIGIALLATVLCFLLGTGLGLLSATRGGLVDQLISRAIDTLMAIPMIIFALLLLTITGTSIPAMVGIIAFLEMTRVYRLARAVGMTIVRQECVEVARLRGEGLWWIIWREILPNCIAPLVAEFGLRFCFVFLFISTLSFLGLGIQPPWADWGSMVRENATLVAFGDMTPLLPAVAIAILTISVNLVIDWFLHQSSGFKD